MMTADEALHTLETTAGISPQQREERAATYATIRETFAERDALAARVAELEAKLERVCTWAAGLCVSHPHLVPHDIAHVEREEGVGDERGGVSAHDVAAYILSKCDPMTAMKLQKLVYYSQAWSVVWDERPLFHERIEAWANGPVVRELYDTHRGQFIVASWPKGNPGALDEEARETVDSVIGFYGDKSPQWLSDLMHMEGPWNEPRQGLKPDERGNNEITHAMLAEYYGGLAPDDEQRDVLAARVAELEAALAEEQHWVAEWRALAEAREAALRHAIRWALEHRDCPPDRSHEYCTERGEPRADLRQEGGPCEVCWFNQAM